MTNYIKIRSLSKIIKLQTVCLQSFQTVSRRGVAMLLTATRIATLSMVKLIGTKLSQVLLTIYESLLHFPVFLTCMQSFSTN